MSKEEMLHEFDLGERTAKFGERIIIFCRLLPKDVVSNPIISQLIRASTSVGANYCEADCAESKKDFEHKMGIANKEAKESTHWLRMIGSAVPEKIQDARLLWKEAHELNLIFVTIIKNSKGNKKKLNIEV